MRLTVVFPSREALESARAAIAGAGGQIEAIAGPVPPHSSAPSPVRLWVLGGGAFGFVAGWALTIGTALALPVRVGGKPILSLPAFFVIAFELTILFAALAGLAGFLRSTRLPVLAGELPPAEAGIDGFVIRARCVDSSAGAVRAAMERAGGRVLAAAENLQSTGGAAPEPPEATP